MRRPLALALAVTLGAGCSAGLSHGLDERQANEVVAALERAGVAAEKSPDEAQGRWRVLVPRGELGRAFAVVEARGLPRRGAQGMGEAFAGGGLIPSRVAERARLMASLGSDLERTLGALPGVTGARVHLALPDDDPLSQGGAHLRVTASVVLQGAPSLAEADVRKLVAGGVPGLQPADVTVLVTAPPPEVAPPPLAQLGPLRVAAGSRALAAGLLSVALGAILLLSVLVAWGAVRMAGLRRRLRELESQGGGAPH